MPVRHIFVSHSTVDNPWCRELVKSLQGFGYEVWFDENQLTEGDRWRTTLERAIREHDIFVVVWSPEASTSSWVENEVTLALRLNRVMIPILHRPAERENFIFNNQGIMAIGLEGSEIAQRLHERLESQMSAPALALPNHLTQYRETQRQIREHDGHHDQRRQAFLTFLDRAFGVTPDHVQVEALVHIQNRALMATRVRKGWIDAVFQDLIFEFKRDLKREKDEGLRELCDYLSNIPNGAACVGLLTDGLRFSAYVLDQRQPTGLRQIDEIDLESATATPEAVYSWFDAYLFRQKQQPPTSADIVRRFGLRSPSFATLAGRLRTALATFAQQKGSTLDVKRQQWAFYLARVYGKVDARDDEMFIRHTYLCQFAKILAAAAHLGPDAAAAQIGQVVEGRAFEVMGFSNIGEQDFFAWIVAPEVAGDVLPLFAQIARALAVYDLQRIDQDLLKQLYQSLVEPETRHELGEFYTPDWLAELTLETIDYHAGQSLLDPACGSGTFLFAALRRLARLGVTGSALIDFALDQVMGVDVHPLAVTVAKINYMLALLPHLHQQSRTAQPRPIPIAMANSLQVAESDTQLKIAAFPIPFDLTGQVFRIPVAATGQVGLLIDLLAEMGQVAQRTAQTKQPAKFGEHAITKLGRKGTATEEVERLLWNDNAAKLVKLIEEDKDTIWVYVLQNTTRPAFLEQRKFDVIAGNPPWLSYRYISDTRYQADVKRLVQTYGLHDPKDRKLNTQIELSTIFYEHASKAYLKPGGTIAFVMPLSVITGAKQHQRFQQTGFSRILDLEQVAPLFNVGTCVLIREGAARLTQQIPVTRYHGDLPAHECALDDARPRLSATMGTITFAEASPIASPYYHKQFLDGATLYPRTLMFVTPVEAIPGIFTTIMQTDPEMDAAAKAPWKGLRVQGAIDDAFLYATLLSKYLIPFGYTKLHLVALPMLAQGERFVPMTPNAMRDAISYMKSADEWFAPAEALWDAHRKSTMTFWQQINYQKKILNQSPAPGYLVLYGATGSNLAACVLNARDLPDIHRRQPQALVIDHKQYWYRAHTPDEAHYLAALLNAPCVNAAIKSSQTRGLFGARDIHRRPFEICPIPPFDAEDPAHVELARLSQAAHGDVLAAAIAPTTSIGLARRKARTAAQAAIMAIDALARPLLDLEGVAVAPINEEDDAEDDMDDTSE